MNQYLKCTEYIGDYYGIQPTAAGEFIVRRRDGYEISRWRTIDEARADAEKLQEKDIREREERVKLWAADRQFSNDHRDLTNAQLRWQDWRRWFHDRLVQEDRLSAHNKRAVIPKKPAYSDDTGRYEKNAKHQEDANRLYERVMSLDAEIKQARQQRDVGRLTHLLIESELVIQEMRQHFDKPHPDSGDLHLEQPS